MIKITIESLDGKVITPRTGKTKCTGWCREVPSHRDYLHIYYLNEDCESPGVAIETNQVEQINNEYNFVDSAKRPFKITVLDVHFNPYKG